MNTMFLIAAGGLALLLLAKGFVTASPAAVLRNLKQIVALTLLIFGLFLILSGRWLVAIPLIVTGVGALLPNILAGRGFPGMGSRGAKPTGRRSTVRSAALEMELDHDSGVMSGRVLAGTFEGRELARLSITDLGRLWMEIRRDPESRALLEAYLDRREPGWREHVERDTAAGQGGSSAPGAMTEQEAYQILGLQAGSPEAEIRDAHRRLMKAVHPDRGGSNFLAAKINEAKDRLIGKHKTRSNH